MATTRRHPAPQPVAVDDHGLGVLEDAVCLDLLAARSVGRLGFTHGALPRILPVNYAVVGSTVYFASEEGAKVRAARRRDVACLEVDDVDPLEHRGWSVNVTGRLELVDPDEAPALDGLHLAPWALTGDVWTIRLPIELVTGRVVGRY